MAAAALSAANPPGASSLPVPSSTRRPLPGSHTAITHHPDPTTTMLVPSSEADRLVDSLHPSSVSEVGSDSFLRMYGRDLERLSLQAHLSAASAAAAASGFGDGGFGGSPAGDHEYVVEAVLTYGKLPVLVRTLLAVELWRTRVLTCSSAGGCRANANDDEADDDECGGGAAPFETENQRGADFQTSTLAHLLAENGNSLRTAFVLHVETTIVGLLNLVMYKREAFDDMDNETAIALVDYCARCMASLAAPLTQNETVRRQKELLARESAAELADRIASRSALDEIIDARLDAEYKTFVGAAALARYLCENIASLPLGAQTRILDTHDFLVLAVPLVDEPPWTRRRPAGVWEKYVDGSWVGVGPADLLQVTKCEAQPWIMLFHLTCNAVCRERYGLSAYRKEQLLRLRKFLNEVVVDQLPVLADVMRYMDELALMDVPESSTGQGSALLMQQVDVMRESLTGELVWEDVARTQFEDIFSGVTDATDEELRLIADVYGEDGFETVLGESTATHPFEPTSLPLEEITICLSDGDDNDNGNSTAPIDALKLIPAEDSPETIVQTPHGPFRRVKMSVRRLDGDDAPLSVSPHCAVVAKAYFEGLSHQSTTLRCDDIALPLPRPAGDAIKTGASKSKEWRQLGCLEERLVLQLGFKLQRPGQGAEDNSGLSYTIEQAFVSQPALVDGKP